MIQIPSSQEIQRALRGAIALLKFDRGGLGAFDFSQDGFWKSFFALAMVMPALLVAETVLGAGTSPIAARLARSSVNLVFHWVLFIAIALPLCRAAGLEKRYMPFITLYNWCSVIGAALFMAPALAVMTGVLTREGGQFLVAATSLYVIFYLWFVAKTALDNNGWVAAGFVILDLALNITIEGFFGLKGG